VNPVLAAGVAQGLGIEVPAAMPLASDLPIPEYALSPTLSLLFRPGEMGIRTRRVAVLVAAGVDAAMVQSVYASLLADGAVPRLVGSQLGKVATGDGSSLDVEISLEAGPSVLYDAVVVPDGAAAAEAWTMDAHALDFVRDQYRHCKPMLVIGSGTMLLEKAGIPATLPDGSADSALIGTNSESLAQALVAFKSALSRHRAFERETNPPRV
ncbi:MAG: DJ-1/PfpI family protein, partial [bacterium]